MPRRQVPTSSLAGAFAGLAAFPIVVLTLNLVQVDSYHPIRQAMSELALGRAGWLMAIGFSAMGIGTILLALILRRSANARLAPLLLALAGLLDFVSAAFHTDPGSATATLHGRVHNNAGIATFVLFVIAIFAAARAFRHSETWRHFATPTFGWGVVAVAAFFLFPLLGDGRFGLAQRIFVATWLSWALTTTARAKTRSRTTSQPAGRSSVATVIPATENQRGGG